MRLLSNAISIYGEQLGQTWLNISERNAVNYNVRDVSDKQNKTCTNLTIYDHTLCPTLAHRDSSRINVMKHQVSHLHFEH